MAIRVTVWNEFRHEKKSEKIAQIYPNGMHETIAGSLRKDSALEVRTATLDEPEHGLTEEVVKNTDVFVWWGHMAHNDVDDKIVDRVHDRILEGAGIVVLHSGHFSKIFKKLMGTTCNLKWREHPEEREILWVTRPGHPVVEGIEDHFILPHEEMYGEFFDIPEPDCTFLISTFTGGECFRSGCEWRRGAGTVIYFRPGHESFPTYHDPNVQRVILNAVKYVAPKVTAAPSFGHRKMGWIDGKTE